MNITLTSKEILTLLGLENERAELIGEQKRIEAKIKALDNAIFRKGSFAKELAASNNQP